MTVNTQDYTDTEIRSRRNSSYYEDFPTIKESYDRRDTTQHQNYYPRVETRHLNYYNVVRTENQRESRFLTAHQHKNRPFSAIRGKNRSKWDNQVNKGKYLTT